MESFVSQVTCCIKVYTIGGQNYLNTFHNILGGRLLYLKETFFILHTVLSFHIEFT